LINFHKTCMKLNFWVLSKLKYTCSTEVLLSGA
jgi:hypothetical protein